ncbi:uncharacterized protein EAF02_010742 [Botrytis sinoallii]|uniref:uncharacterized protein n=1 Tax=Botrytis sinoallii TaxID=1463999 RepID=UPI0019005E3E|nr:uncharacterized protein EAF02_010742 [Botrytis sinoallii]KAF7860508.1 hypothetical protein EAF02_010742 [Botrytis sinoallii]
MDPPLKGFYARQLRKALCFSIAAIHLTAHMLFLGLYYILNHELRRYTVVLHFDGASFIFGSSRVSECSDAAELLIKHKAKYALLVQYDLVCDSALSFSVALQDGVNARKHLVYLGISPSKIVISGDSAGGNIAVVLLRHVSEEESDGGNGYFLPNLVSYTLWGSSIDLPSQTCAHIDTHRDYITDHLAGLTLEWGINLYFPDLMEVTDSWFSLLLYSFPTPVPIRMVTERQREILSHTIVEFAAETKEVEGNKVELHEI